MCHWKSESTLGSTGGITLRFSGGAQRRPLQPVVRRGKPARRRAGVDNVTIIRQ
jgi:hypothetical protein